MTYLAIGGGRLDISRADVTLGESWTQATRSYSTTTRLTVSLQNGTRRHSRRVGDDEIRRIEIIRPRCCPLTSAISAR